MPALRFIIIGVSLAAYLGLAVLGAGGVAAFFAQPAFIALTFVLAALGLASSVRLAGRWPSGRACAC
jgi:hypothetical protein